MGLLDFPDDDLGASLINHSGGKRSAHIVICISDAIVDLVEIGRTVIEDLKVSTNCLIRHFQNEDLSEMQVEAWERFAANNHDFCMLSKQIETHCVGNDSSIFGPADVVLEQFLMVDEDFVRSVKQAIECGLLKQVKRIRDIIEEVENVIRQIHERRRQMQGKHQRIPAYERAKLALINA